MSVGAINAYLHEKKVGLPARSIVFLERLTRKQKEYRHFHTQHVSSTFVSNPVGTPAGGHRTCKIVCAKICKCFLGPFPSHMLGRMWPFALFVLVPKRLWAALARP